MDFVLPLQACLPYSLISRKRLEPQAEATRQEPRHERQEDNTSRLTIFYT